METPDMTVAYANEVKGQIEAALYEARHLAALTVGNSNGGAEALGSAVGSLREALYAFKAFTGDTSGEAEVPLRSPMMPERFMAQGTPVPQPEPTPEPEEESTPEVEG